MASEHYAHNARNLLRLSFCNKAVMALATADDDSKLIRTLRCGFVAIRILRAGSVVYLDTSATAVTMVCISIVTPRDCHINK